MSLSWFIKVSVKFAKEKSLGTADIDGTNVP